MNVNIYWLLALLKRCVTILDHLQTYRFNLKCVRQDYTNVPFPWKLNMQTVDFGLGFSQE